MVSYRVMLDVPRELVLFVSGLLAAHRREIGTRRAFKLIESAQEPLACRQRTPHLVALVCAGATFINGKLVERPAEEAQPEAA